MSSSTRAGRIRPAPLIRFVAGFAALLAFTGCAAGGASAELPADAPLPTEVPPGTELVVADQQERVQTLFRASGELDKIPARVEFANFVGGPEVLESFRAEATDVAIVGDTPPIHAQASGEDVPIVAAFRIDPNSTRFAVAPGVQVRTLPELRGKKIAYAEGTAQQTAVLRALEKAGLRTEDVQLVRLQLAEFNDAVRTGAVDVAPLNEPRLTRFLAQTGGRGTTIPVAETDGTSTGVSYLYTRRAALEDPAKAAAIRAFVEHFAAARQWAATHPAEWIDAYYVRSQGVTRADGERIVASEGTVEFPRLASLISTQQHTIDLLAAAGGLPKPLNAHDHFDLRFDAVLDESVRRSGGIREGSGG
ncbi:ABC transporter substrate-binding protein [Saccharopolyspora hirsuta]|uniref:ABC transporter substrate-binding protein n=1 Tax=Saccharopolyspora hirsuta TaxID=1837 RepID=A0A5M7BPX6_SACHI|nr:ABC transporter substrate-binding protein [Saccharopolyspora hirsuta]KAA5830198.1 ABC transporter substrate-binding protein [Saccharopolyspora hirsuta]